jgi:hypothetical protein
LHAIKFSQGQPRLTKTVNEPMRWRNKVDDPSHAALASAAARLSAAAGTGISGHVTDPLDCLFLV